MEENSTITYIEETTMKTAEAITKSITVKAGDATKYTVVGEVRTDAEVVELTKVY